MRADVTAHLSDLCTVQRPGAEVSDGAGGWSSTFAPVAGLTNVACRLSPRSQESRARGEQLVAGRITAQGDWLITFPALSDVRNGDQVIVTVIGQPARTFEVLGTDGPRSLETARLVAAAEVST